MNGLSEAEREGLIEAVQAGTEVEYVEAIVAARLASVKALADEWEHVGKTDRAAKRAHDKLRAVLGSDAHTEPCDPDCEAGPTHDPDLHLPRHKHAHTEQKGAGE